MEHVVGAAALVIVWGFALFWYGFLALMASIVWARPPAQGARAPLAILAVFAAAGLLLLIFAVRSTWHRLRFGRSAFEMDDVPFRPGGWVGGIVHAPASLHVPAFSVALDCQEVWEGGRQSTHRSVVWREEAIVGAELLGRDSSGVYVPVSIAIPADARPTSAEPGREIEWRLTVSAARPGLDYDASFEVPVFAVPGPIPDPVQLAGSPDNVITIADFTAPQYGVRVTGGQQGRAMHALDRAVQLTRRIGSACRWRRACRWSRPPRRTGSARTATCAAGSCSPSTDTPAHRAVVTPRSPGRPWARKRTA